MINKNPTALIITFNENGQNTIKMQTVRLSKNKSESKYILSSKKPI